MGRVEQPAPQKRPSLLILYKGETHVDRGFHFHRLAVEHGRFVSPLPDGFHRGRSQQGVSRSDHRQTLDGSVHADKRVQMDHA